MKGWNDGFPPLPPTGPRCLHGDDGHNLTGPWCPNIATKVGQRCDFHDPAGADRDDASDMRRRQARRVAEGGCPEVDEHVWWYWDLRWRQRNARPCFDNKTMAEPYLMRMIAANDRLGGLPEIHDVGGRHWPHCARQ